MYVCHLPDALLWKIRWQKLINYCFYFQGAENIFTNVFCLEGIWNAMNFKFLNIFGKKAFNPGQKIDSTVLLYTEKWNDGVIKIF